ncbi:methyltransferase family protein [Pararhodospirillum oryzae]|uniref:Isoprenylcysteine carboxyl methyltransferase n=1 Tax=Pararhodospirillum oryzae TaxID=478448 RepID=A0A512HBY3_9PROT|nr:isoprenylcysteine carboxylmethyltransferase family protein [Pararhodospirillum oryzae]GEO82961.1 hypothetical protein ROR02_30920 [Pararhodospirillum oryzae]
MKPLPPVLFGTGVVLMAVLAWLLPGPRVVPDALGLAGLALIAGAGTFAVMAARHVLRQGTTVHPGHEATVLVTDGPFRLTRNPMYLGLAGILTGWGLWLGTLVPLLVVPVFVLAIARLHIDKEEARLRARFGEAFEAYCQSTRRWL